VPRCLVVTTAKNFWRDWESGLCGIANSGEIYIDTDTSGRLKKANVEEIGAREIKGFREPVRVHKVNRTLAVEGVSNK